MAEYIDRQEVLAFKYHSREYDSRTQQFNQPVVDVYDILEIPAADVAPVRRGRWIRHILKNANTPFGYDCSVCDEWLVIGEDTAERYNYCPNCGARMGEDR